MLIDYESIIIIEGKAAGEIMNGTVRTILVQKSSADGFAENSFARNSAVIQCISPSANDGNEKVKFSVMYKPAASVRFEKAAVVFSSETEGHYEIRCQNETVSEGECRMSAITVTPSETEGKLEIEFAAGDNSGTADILSELNNISAENSSVQDELNALSQQYEDEVRKNEMLLSQKDEVSVKLNSLKEETEKLSQSMTELSELEAKCSTLKKNLDENQLNSEKSRKLTDQLRAFSEILEFYRTEDGFESVSEKLVSVSSDLETICSHISELADRRTELNDMLSEE